MVNKIVGNLHEWKLIFLMPVHIQKNAAVVSGLPHFTKQNKGKKKVRSKCIATDSSNIGEKDSFSPSIRCYKL